jgi:glycine/D-amino acid oxidase-like deaminating enzyme
MEGKPVAVREATFFNTGVLWFCYEESTPLVDDSIPFSKKHQMEYEYLTSSQLKTRFPQTNVADLHHAWLDPFGGYLKARESVQTVCDAFVKEGGKFLLSHVQPGKVDGDRPKQRCIIQWKLSAGRCIYFRLRLVARPNYFQRFSEML